MREIEELMSIVERACVSFKETCGGEKCPLYIKEEDGDGCALDIIRRSTSEPREKVIDWGLMRLKLLQWDLDHPVPRYPTWSEWWDSMAKEPLEAVACECKFMAISNAPCKHPLDFGNNPCRHCPRRPIPEHIAVKLGIKEIGGLDEPTCD